MPENNILSLSLSVSFSPSLSLSLPLALSLGCEQGVVRASIADWPGLDEEECNASGGKGETGLNVTGVGGILNGGEERKLSNDAGSTTVGANWWERDGSKDRYREEEEEETDGSQAEGGCGTAAKQVEILKSELGVQLTLNTN